MRMPRTSIVALAALASALCACAHRGATRPSEPDLGAVAGGVYRNESFGLTLPVPEDWQAEPRETVRQAVGQGMELLSAKGTEADQVRGAVNAAMSRILPLAMLTRKPRKGSAFAAVLIVAMPLAPEERDMPVPETLRSVVKNLQAAGARARELSAPHPVTLGGLPMQAIEYAVDTPDGTVRQTSHLAVFRKHGLYINLIYDSDEGSGAAQALIAGLRVR